MKERKEFSNKEIIKEMNGTNEEKEIFIEWVKGATQKVLMEKYNEKFPSTYKVSKFISRMRARYFSCELKKTEKEFIAEQEQKYGKFSLVILQKTKLHLSRWTYKNIIGNRLKITEDFRDFCKYTEREVKAAMGINVKYKWWNHMNTTGAIYMRHVEKEFNIIKETMNEFNLKFKEEN